MYLITFTSAGRSSLWSSELMELRSIDGWIRRHDVHPSSIIVTTPMIRLSISLFTLRLLALPVGIACWRDGSEESGERRGRELNNLHPPVEERAPSQRRGSRPAGRPTGRESPTLHDHRALEGKPAIPRTNESFARSQMERHSDPLSE